MADIGSNLALWAKYNGDLLDSSGNGRDGTGTNSPTFATGRVGQGLDLEASSSQFVNYGTGVPVDGAAALTLSVWIKPESLTDFTFIAGKADGLNARFSLLLGGSGFGGNNDLIASVGDGANTFGNTAGDFISAGSWTHVAMVYNGGFTDGNAALQNAGRLKLYTNGTSRALTFTGNIPAATGSSTTNNFQVGRQASGSLYYDGMLDDLRVYTRTLAQADITALFYYGRTVGTGTSPSLPPGGRPSMRPTSSRIPLLGI